MNKNYGNVINRPQNNTKHVGFDSILTIREKKKNIFTTMSSLQALRSFAINVPFS